jgi:hypothetical protein
MNRSNSPITSRDAITWGTCQMWSNSEHVTRFALTKAFHQLYIDATIFCSTISLERIC